MKGQGPRGEDERRAPSAWLVPISILVAAVVVAGAIAGSVVFLEARQASLVPGRTSSSAPSATLVTTDPKSLVLQNADVPSGYLVDSQQSGANPEVFAGIGARRIGALFAGAVPSDSYQQVFRGPVATPFEQLSVISAVAIYRSVGDAASVKPDPRSDLFANEVGQGTPLGDGGHVYASSRSKVLVLVIVYWRDRNVIAYLRWYMPLQARAECPTMWPRQRSRTQ